MDKELREKIAEILASCLSDNDIKPRVKEIFDAFEEDFSGNIKPILIVLVLLES